MKKRWKRIMGMLLAGCMMLTAVPVSAVTVETPQFEINELTTEYLASPLGIDADKVRFGWEMDSNVIGAKQTAYQIQVFEKDTGNLVWDSQKVASGQSTGIVCDAKLQEAASYRWEVTVWNEDGETMTAESVFETGVTNQEEWKAAEFICMNASAAAPIFRTEQALEEKTIEKARLYITALGAYEAYVNGSRVGELDENGEITYHHMNPGYGNKTVSLGYQTYDITSFLSGDTKAAISVVAGNGWYSGMATTTSSPAVKALAVIEYADGERQVIQTNTTDWKGTLAGGIVGNGVYYGEDYNASFAEALGDFTQTGYDDSAWVNAEGSDTEDYRPCIENRFAEQNASYVRVLVNQTGPAQSGVNEHFLQIMELELLDAQGNNVAAGIVPEVSNTWSPNGQWAPEHLTDGDYGDISDYGYTTTLFGTNGLQSYTLATPISITFQLGKEVGFETLKMYPRTAVESVSQYECANYPKNYTLQVSDDGTHWRDVDTYSVDAVRNTVLFPEAGAISYGTDFQQTHTAKHVRISVSETGSAVKEDNENRLQIMELELLNGLTNVASGVVPAISNNFEAGTQWNAANMTNGDYGSATDAGYTSDILGYGNVCLELTNPITIQFDFDEAVSFSELKIYPRTGKEALSYGLCVNYPKVYTVQISDDGVTWEDIAAEQDAGMVRNTNLLENTRMATTTYPGTIRAQAGTPGKLIDAFDQTPVSVVLYTGTKAESSYAGGEIAVDAAYTAAAGENVFEGGIELKKGQTMVVNMGQNLSAVPNIQFAAQEATVATLRFAEMLNDGSSVGSGATQADGPKGSIYQKSIRAARSAVTYFFAGNGVETYQPSMSFFGYQYVEITATNDITVYGLTSKAISSVSEQTGNIETNNENVNKLFLNVLYGQLSNYYTTPTDCNQRDERLSWTGDTQAFAQTAVYNFNSVAFLNDMQDIYNENTWIKGYVPGVADDLTGFFSPWAAGWSDVEIIVPWTLYQQTGDISMLTDSWDAMNHYMEYLLANERGTNQAPASGSQNYGDWLAFQGTCIEVINDYYYGYVNQLMAKIAGIIGDEEKETQYSNKFEAIKEKFLETHVEFTNGELLIRSNVGDANLHFMTWTDKKGILEANSQTSLLWMLKLGFYDSEEMKDAALALLLENVKNENPDVSSVRAGYGKNTLAVGFLGSNIITPVLTETGSADVSYDLLLQDEQPSWLFEVKAGATTIWERWNSYTPGVGFGDSEMNSFNHYAYGSVVEWMYRYMAGISADESNPGFKHIVLQPTMDTGVQYNEEERINSVNGSYDSYYGDIVSEWTSSEGKLVTYHTEIPANTTATLYLPVEESAMTDFAAPRGVAYAGMREHNGQMTAKILLESGGYDFAVEDGKVTVAYADGYVAEEFVKETIAQFTFDDETTGFTSATAVASGTYSLQEHDGGKALYLDGTGNFLEVTATDGSSLLSNLDELTVSFQAKPDAGATNWLFYAAPDAETQQYMVENYLGILDNGSLLAERFKNTNGRPATATAAIETDDWYHVAVVYTKTETIIYVNGEEAARQSSDYALSDILGYNSILYIGKANWGNGEYYKGLIDNYTIMNYAMTADEVKNLYVPLEPQQLPFTDVVESDWFYDAVYYNYFGSLMTGLTDTAFGPYEELSRAQMALILYRMEGAPEVTYSNVFGDLPDGTWFTSAVLWAQENGIVTGYGNTGTFGPFDQISREQIAVMMYRYAGYKAYDISVSADLSTFTDAANVSTYAETAVKWAVGAGIITGKSNGTAIAPQDNTLRAECAMIIQRFMEEYAK